MNNDQLTFPGILLTPEALELRQVSDTLATNLLIMAEALAIAIRAADPVVTRLAMAECQRLETAINDLERRITSA